MKKKDILDLVCELLNDCYGTCPFDQFLDWTGSKCMSGTCRDIDDMCKCWREYLEDQVNKKGGEK